MYMRNTPIQIEAKYFPEKHRMFSVAKQTINDRTFFGYGLTANKSIKDLEANIKANRPNTTIWDTFPN